MASYPSMALMGAILLMFLLAWASATVYTVGDSTGWTTGYDYSTWTSGKTFNVGDSLVFNYTPSAHTVNEVAAGDYNACSSINYLSTDSSGTTTIPFKTAGNHYFVCGVPGHCAGGMKLSVSVFGSGSGGSSNTPPTTSTPSTSTPSTTPPSTTTTGGGSAGYNYAAAGSPSPSLGLVVGAVAVAVKLGVLV